MQDTNQRSTYKHTHQKKRLTKPILILFRVPDTRIRRAILLSNALLTLEMQAAGAINRYPRIPIINQEENGPSFIDQSESEQHCYYNHGIGLLVVG